MTGPKVAVLVAAYNATSTLPRCLDSLRNQTLTDIEVLCVDDCSTDGTFDLLHRYAQADHRFRLWRTPVNSGQAVARNMALTFARATYVCMVDADDWLSADCLERAVDVFAQHPATDCVVFRLTEVLADGREHDYGLPAELADGGSMSGSEAFEACLDGWRLHGLYLTRTALHKQIPFDTATRLYSDDNTARLHYLHSREVRACSGVYFYRKHDESATTAFHLGRFDFMEANLSLKRQLEAEGVDARLLRRFESSRWLTFVTCYRLYLEHEAELTAAEQAALRQRFAAILDTFRGGSVPFGSQHRSRSLYVRSLRWFDMQQRFFMWLRAKVKGK